MSSDIAISVRNLTKTYRIFNHPGDRIKQAFTFGRVKFHREFTALKDVSFEIKKGETVGIIGRNGSGKSTLLQLICGILKPTSGSVTVNGRISALLELGSGFNPEFTGRENIYFQGAIMGFSKEEMDARVEDIIAFADIGEFIDQPVRTYSSGMFVRLAFATAIHSEPEILVVDEALAVGDVAFQTRCFKRMAEIQRQGGSILLVTHAMEQVAHFCDQAMWLDQGVLKIQGKSAETLDSYLNSIGRSNSKNSDNNFDEDNIKQSYLYNPNELRWGDRAATLFDCKLIQNGQENPSFLVPGLTAEMRLHIRFNKAVHSPVYGLAIKSYEGAIVFTTNSRQLLGKDTISQKEGDEVFISFEFQPFLDNGDYSISLGVASGEGASLIPHDRRYDVMKFSISKPRSPAGELVVNPAFNILSSL
jgi:lipopolysaccharide transport system ATP-binding protein